MISNRLMLHFSSVIIALMVTYNFEFAQIIIYYFHRIIIRLLMPKVIQPRRHDKELSVEEFWKIRDQGKVSKSQDGTVKAYREEQVSQRHRFLRPSEKAKSFNPLAMILRRQNRGQSNQLYAIREEDDNTFVGQYLSSVQNKVTSTLSEFKKLTLGRKSIIYNIEKIYELLWSNLQIQQSWILLQAILKDLRGERFDLWINEGFKRISQAATQIIGLNFNEIFFRNVFNTICIFMQNNYEHIASKIKEYFAQFSQQFMKHTNKYIRRFSVQSFSYILSNLMEEQYESFMYFLVEKQTQGYFDSQFKLADLLLQRLKNVRGCLTAASLSHFLAQIETLGNIFYSQHEQNPELFTQISSEFIGLVLLSLNNRQGTQDDKILFDFAYTLKGLIKFSTKNEDRYVPSLIKGFSSFIVLYKTDKKRFTPSSKFQINYIKEVWQILASFFKQKVKYFEQDEHLSIALAILLLKSNSTIYYDGEIIKYFKVNVETVQALIEIAYEQESQLEQGLLEIILLLSRQHIKRFIIDDQKAPLIYSLIILLKRAKLANLLEFSWLEIEYSHVKSKLERALLQDDLIVVLRLLSFFSLEKSKALQLCQTIKIIYSKTMGKYEEYMNSLLSKKSHHALLQPKEFYESSNFIKEIILNSHHQIEWLSHIFNIYEAFSLIIQHLSKINESIAVQSSSIRIWNELIVSRPSAISIFNLNGYLKECLINNKLILNLLSSRVREVRYSALQIIRDQLDTNCQFQLGLIDKLQLIDQNSIELYNEREIKRIFVNLQQSLQNYKESINQQQAINLLKVMIKWSLGFAFTGFKLIEKVFITFFVTLINIDLKENDKTVVEQLVMPFLEYYNYRHSRQYEHDISKESTSCHLTNAFTVETNKQLKPFIREDFELTDIETVQWIGLERISEAIKISKHGKINLGSRLNLMVSAYFSLQFKRRSDTIEKHSSDQNLEKKFLLPIKVRFLIVILKLCPENYLPPYQCLHFTRQQYFQLPKVKQIKKNGWQSMWEKKKSDNPKKKIEVTEIASTTVNLQHLSPQQRQMYLHYLWKDILESNRHKKRIIIDHIRNYLPTSSVRLIQLLFEYLHMKDIDCRLDNEDTVKTVVNRLKLMNRKNLLNGMFILKSILLHLRQEVNSEVNLKTILVFILSIIQIVYDYSSYSQREQNQQEGDQDDEEEEEQQDQEDSENKGFQYKQHRKELQKLLQTLFAHHQLEPETIKQLLQFLLANNKINLPKTSRLSVPGLLLILQIISQQKQYGVVLANVKNGQIIKMLSDMVKADEVGTRPLKACFNIWIKIMENFLFQKPDNIDQNVVEYQQKLTQSIKQHTNMLLPAILSYINADDSKHEIKGQKQLIHKKKEIPENLRFVKIISKLMQLHDSSLQSQWQKYIWEQLSKITKIRKNLTPIHCEKLSLLIVILSRYINLRVEGGDTKNFLRRVIGVLPVIKDTEQRLSILNLIVKNHKQLGLKQRIVNLVSKMSQLKKVALTITMDFTLFFQSCNEYTQNLGQFSLVDHEYLLHNLLCYIDNEELSVRRAVSNCCKLFLEHMSNRLNGKCIVDQRQQESNQILVLLVLKVYRVLLQMLPKVQIQVNQSIYWNIIENIGQFFGWISQNQSLITIAYPKSNAKYYSFLNVSLLQDENYFKLLGSISESNKLKGLKVIRNVLQSMKQQQKCLLIEWPLDTDIDIPNPISKIILPILQFLIMKPTQNKNYNNNNTVTIKSNLSSTFSKTSLDLLPLISSYLKQSLVKRQLKRLVSKIKFSQTESKKNMAVIKIISNIIEGVPGERVNQRLKSYIEQHGFDQFHSKIAEYSKTNFNQDVAQQQSEQEQVGYGKKKERVPDYYQRLQELQSEEAINRNFMHFDKKMMDLEDQEQQTQEKGQFSHFLKKQILLPLRTMLMMENKSKPQQEKSKGRMLLSVTVTKVLLRLPLDLFLRQFQKVIGKLGRLLKNKQTDVRQNSRSCLCQIAKSVGSQLLYAIILQLRFYLKDNFDKHVFNYTMFKILEALELSSGDLDYCIPLILPLVIDEIFGKTSEQKQMVSRHQAPTLKVQAKKRKGLDLLQILCKSISQNKIGYIIEFLEKYLREHLVTEVNLGKYDQMLGAISSGLSSNNKLIDPENASTLLPVLSQPVSKLRQQIRLLNWQDKAKHQNTQRKEWVRRKANKDQILTLQEQTGRNGSIFKKMSKEISEKRNQQIIASSLIQFYLALLSLFIRKHVFTLNSTTNTQELANHILTLLGFLCQCIDHRDNRLVAKSLKILHLGLRWKTSDLTGDKQQIGDKFKSLKKQTSRKILLLIQQLTLADEQLLKECFIFLNDLIEETTINVEILPNFVAIIKLHLPTTSDQPHLSETYKLLRTILYKCPLLIFNPFLDDLRKLVRLQIVTCHNKQIRQILKNILSVYLRPKNVLQASIQAHNLTQKKQGNKQKIVYEKRLQEEITFYLSNLQSTGQQAILELIQQLLNNREQIQLQNYGELLLLGLMTARTNQIQKDRSHPIDALVVKIINKLEQAKIFGLIQKCLLWMKQQRHSSILMCGTSLLRIILENYDLKINKNFIEKYLICKDGILEITSAILSKQVAEFQINKNFGESSLKVDKQWGDILNNMQEQKGYECDSSSTEVVLLISKLLQDQTISNINSDYLKQFIVNCWKFLQFKSQDFTTILISCLSKISLLPILIDYSQNEEKLFFNQKHQFSAKKTLAALIFNSISTEQIERLFKKLLLEQSKLYQENKILIGISWLIVGLSLKAHIKPIVYKKELPNLLYLLNNLILCHDEDLNCKKIIFAQPNFQAKLLQMTVKLSGNHLISQEARALNETSTQIIKQWKGVAEYFKDVGQFQTKRREKKQQNITRIAEMAILNPQEFIEEKRGKKRKI